MSTPLREAALAAMAARLTTTATGNVAIGHAVVAATSADTTARVRLSGSTPAGT